MEIATNAETVQKSSTLGGVTIQILANSRRGGQVSSRMQLPLGETGVLGHRPTGRLPTVDGPRDADVTG